MTIRAFISALALLPALAAAPAPAAEAGCGGADAPCVTAGGSYHAALPIGHATGPRPAVLFFHGAGGLGRSVLERTSHLRSFVEAGYVVLGANGLMRPGNAFGTGWSFRPEGPQQRDELGFAREVIADAAQRFGVDRQRILVSGFSIGASLTWYLACRDPSLGAAYAPVAGGFWRPHPQACTGPIDLLHSHGWRDRTVPLEGRPLRGGELVQGDVFEGLQLWREVNGCRQIRPDSFETGPVFWLRAWKACDSDREIVLALHASDHDDIPASWAEMARLWFEQRLAARAAK